MIIGEKLGMTRIFDKDNKHVPVTVIQAGPCPIMQIKKADKHGYNAVQIGFGKTKHTTKPLQGHLNKTKLDSIKICKEFKITENEIANYKEGDNISLNILKIGDKVDVTSTSKGKGYAGVMKRHGFAGMPASHGHEKPRIPGSIGCRFPQRVVKGKRMAGHMGVDTVTVRNLRIIDIDMDNNLISVKGAIPGPKKSLLTIKAK